MPELRAGQTRANGTPRMDGKESPSVRWMLCSYCTYLRHHSTRDVAPNIAVVTTVVLVASVVTTLLSLEKEGTDEY